MAYLTDTHAILWWIDSHPSLSPKAQSILNDTNNELFISITSIWEIAIKMNIGKLKVSYSISDVFNILKNADIQILPIQAEHVSLYASLPLHHRDPFDRLQIAQAVHENLVLLSADEAFDQYAVKRVW